MIKYYIGILVGHIIYFSSFVLFIITNTHSFMWFSIVGVEVHNRYSLKIREEGHRTNLFFSLMLFFLLVVSYFYIFYKYSIDIYSVDGVIMLLIPLTFIYVEYTFYTYPLEKKDTGIGDGSRGTLYFICCKFSLVMKLYFEMHIIEVYNFLLNS